MIISTKTCCNFLKLSWGIFFWRYCSFVIVITLPANTHLRTQVCMKPFIKSSLQGLKSTRCRCWRMSQNHQIIWNLPERCCWQNAGVMLAAVKKSRFFSCLMFALFLGVFCWMHEELAHTVDGRNPANNLRCIKPWKYWDKLPINWCRISSINSMSLHFGKASSFGG